MKIKDKPKKQGVFGRREKADDDFEAYDDDFDEYDDDDDYEENDAEAKYDTVKFSGSEFEMQLSSSHSASAGNIKTPAALIPKKQPELLATFP